MDIDISKNYWFSLKPHAYASIGVSEIFLYNTLSGQYINSENPFIVSLIQSVHENINLGVVLLEDSLLKNNDIKYFIEKTCEYGIGEVIDVTKCKNKPIRLMPVLNLQRDVEKLRKQGRSIGEDVLHYLSNVVLYVNNSCELQCRYCGLQHKQGYCCAKEKIPNELSINAIKTLIAQIEYAPVGKIEILGANILDYQYIRQIRNIIPNEIKLNYWIHYENIAKNNDQELINLMQNKIIIVNFPLNQKLFEHCLSKTDSDSIFYFIVENVSQFEQIEGMVQNYDLHSYEITPFYNGSNKDFFIDNVYLTKEDLFTDIVSQRKIFCNQALNSNYFGSLHIYSDGSVRASANTELIGNINNDPIIDIIAKEMDINTAWRKVRSEEPCNSCLYQYLCPPPSNYEYAIGKYNLCHIINA